MDEVQSYNKIRNYLIENNITIDSIIDNIKLLGNIQSSTDLIKKYFNKDKYNENENTTLNITTLDNRINILNQKIDELNQIQDENEKTITIIKNKLIAQENKLLEQEKIINNMKIQIESITNIIKNKYSSKIEIEEPKIELEEQKIELEEPEINIDIKDPDMKDPDPDVKLKEMFNQFETFGKNMAINFIKNIKFNKF
jgi:hypothetical protein